MRLGSAFLAQKKVVDVAVVSCCTRSSRSSAIAFPSICTLFFQMFQKIVQSSLFPSFSQKFFHPSLRSITFELIRIIYYNTVLFAQTHFSVVCCRWLLPCKKQSWYPVSSKLSNYVLEDWRLFDYSLNQKLAVWRGNRARGPVFWTTVMGFRLVQIDDLDWPWRVELSNVFAGV